MATVIGVQSDAVPARIRTTISTDPGVQNTIRAVVPKGDKGDIGPEGKSAYQVAVQSGFIGTQQQWLDSLRGPKGTDGLQGSAGPAGKSAYEVAKANGFTGTEAEWLASLKGADGAAGTGSTAAAFDPFIKPDTTGKWDPRAKSRPTGTTLFWIRQYGNDQIAANPTAADGYLDGDLVYPDSAQPISTDGTVPGATPPAPTATPVMFSDSGHAASNAAIDGRYMDLFSGGTSTSWITGNYDPSMTDVRARVMNEAGFQGIECYSTAYLRPSQSLVAGDTEVEFRMFPTVGGINVALSGEPGVGVVVTNVQLKYDTAKTTVTVTALNTSQGDTTSMTLGTATVDGTATVGAPVVIKAGVAGLTVSINGKTVGTDARSYTGLDRFRIRSWSYNTGRFDNLVVRKKAA